MKNFILWKWMVHNFCQVSALLRGGKEERPLAEANQDSLLNGILFMNQSNALVMKALLVFVLLFSTSFYAQINFTNSQAASLVVGQANFTANVAACTQNGLYAPSYTAISSKGVLAVSEQTGARVKLWNPTPTANGANASVVVGQANFTSCGSSGTTQSSISNSNGVAFSPDGNKLIVTDFSNNRVLIWNTIPTVNGQNADVVLGQANFTSGFGGVSATAMNGPTGAYVSSDGRLLIADRGNHRILIWNSIPTTNNKPADVVVGQTVFNSPGGGSSATTMVNPWGVCVSPDGKLLVADSANNRVLVWNTIPTTNGAAADVVIGQTIMGSNGAGTTATNLNAPIGVTVSPSGKVAIGEFGNSRVLVYNSIPTVNGAAANVVLGQPSFTSSTAFYPSGSATNNNMFSIYNASFDLYGRLYVAGREMNRVLVFGAAPSVQANLGVGITSNISTACSGASNTLTITITNATATAASGVIATASLPAGFTYSSHTASGGTYSPTSGYWNIGAVPASGSRTLTINGIANGSGSLSAYASIVQSNQLDPVLSNNGASVSYSIVGSVPPPTGSATQSFCNAATIANLSATGTSIQWYANATLGSPLATSTPLVNGVTYYASQTLGPCEGTNRLAVAVTIQPLITYYQDADGDGFGNPAVTTTSCTPVAGFVLDTADCNDNQLQYVDADGDGFGSTTQVACGVANNLDTNDNLLTYVDNDGDGFGSITLAPSGVTNNLDCNDNQIQYLDADADGFGSTTQVACGVANNSDTNDNLLTYVDNDGDGFGSTTLAPSGVTNNLDCNDNQIQYADVDGDGFGSTTQVACGVANSTDCDDNQIQYSDVDGDGFGSTTQVPCGVTNNLDCNDNQIQYADVDGDGFGSTIQVACGVTNNSDCNDNQIQYFDGDNDNYGTSVQVACGVANTGDCNDNNAAVNPNATEVCYDGLDNDCDGTIDEGCTPIVSVVQPSQCGVTLATINQNIYANLVAGAQGYRFTVTDMTTNQVQSIDKALRVFQLTQLSNYAFSRTYQVEVSIRFNNVWQPFVGSACLVTTPSAVTQVQAAQCNGQLTTMGDAIYADNVPYGSGYRFRVTNLLTSSSVEVDRLTRDVRLNNIAGFTPEFNTTYSVEVAVKNTNGTYLPYNTIVCNVTTPSFPSTQLQLSQCDVTISNPNTIVYADSYVGATTYRFRFVNGAFTYTFDRPLRSFILSSIPVPAGATYSVQVSIEINGVFGPYGKICTLTIPGSARGNDAVAGNNFQAIASPNPFASTFGLNLSTTSEEAVQVRVYDMLGKLVEDRKAQASDIIELGDNYPSGVYNVIVSQGENTKTLRVIKR